MWGNASLSGGKEDYSTSIALDLCLAVRRLGRTDYAWDVVNGDSEPLHLQGLLEQF